MSQRAGGSVSVPYVGSEDTGAVDPLAMPDEAPKAKEVPVEKEPVKEVKKTSKE